MEPRFDLTEARAAWLSALESRQAFSRAQLQELESHLDDAMEDLLQRGLALPEAFLIATRRLGGPTGLAEEYQKLSSHAAWAIRGKWMVLGILSYLSALALTRTCTEIVDIVALNAPQGHLRLAVTVSGFLVSSIIGAWLLHRCLHGKFPRQPAWVIRHPLGTACGVLLAASLIPVVSGALANILGVHMVNFDDFSKQILVRRYTLMVTPLLWFAILVFSFRRYWGKAAPVS